MRKPFLKIAFSCLMLVAPAMAAAGNEAAPGKMSDAGLVFYAPLDGTLDAQGAGGKTIAPAEARRIKFKDVIGGHAALVMGNGQADQNPALCLAYPIDGLLSSASGTIMFWMNPQVEDNPGAGKPPPSRVFLCGAGDHPETQPGFRLFTWSWDSARLRLDMPVWDEGKKAAVSKPMMLPCPGAWHAGDWLHLAITWSKGGWIKFYCNGMPFVQGSFDAPAGPLLKSDVMFEGINRLFVGCEGSEPVGHDYHATSADALFSDVKIYRDALSEEQIVAEYRTRMPADVTTDRRFLKSGVPETLEFELWPPGTANIGMRSTPEIAQPFRGELAVKIESLADGSVAAEQRFQIDATSRSSLSLPLSPLKPGYYLARFMFPGAHGGQHSVRLLAYAPMPPANEDTSEPKFGVPFFKLDFATAANGVLRQPTSILCDYTGQAVVQYAGITFYDDVPGSRSVLRQTPALGAYREAGPANFNRFAVEIPVPKELADGRPCVLEITWPDDKPRSMGFYLYPESRGDDRDRLEGGVNCGEEYPSPEPRLRTSRYMFYPWKQKYLFEARTMIDGMPAAVSRIEVRPFLGRLPKLPIALPQESLRHLGNWDEDQSFDWMFNLNDGRHGMEKAPVSMHMLLDYLDYTGEDTFCYGFSRYSTICYAVPGSDFEQDSERALLCEQPGFPRLVLDTFRDRGKRVVAAVYLFAMPEAVLRPDLMQEKIAAGYLQIGADGKPLGLTPNILQAEARRDFLGHIREIVRRFGPQPAMVGLDLREGWQINGYNDATIQAFERDTGRQVAAGDGPDRFSRRAKALTGDLKPEWNAWRAKQNAAFVAEVAGILRATRADLVLYAEPAGDFADLIAPVDVTPTAIHADVRAIMLDQGIDLSLWAAIPGVVPVPVFEPTLDRWYRHWNKQIGWVDDVENDPETMSVWKFPNAACICCYKYWESYSTPPLKPDVYSCMFESADVKPAGRDFLSPFTACVADYDPSLIMFGGQPLGSWGREAEIREFARAFRALPAGAYQDVPGLSDPVKARSCVISDVTWLYAANLLWSDVEIEIQAPNGIAAVELGSGNPVEIVNGRLQLSLKPHELKAVRINAALDGLQGKVVSVPEVARSFYAKKGEELQASIEGLEKLDADFTRSFVASLRERQAAFDRSCADGAYAEAHRLAFSKPFRLLSEMAKDDRQGYLKERKEMVAAGHFAVKCGSTCYYRAMNGTLFFPDCAYSPDAKYGFVDSHIAAMNPVETLGAAVEKGLYDTEACCLSGYRFNVPNGRYTVRLYDRIGYEPSAKTGALVMTLRIQGREVWKDFDLFEALHRDMANALVSEFKDIVVTNGVLELMWAADGGFCNDIEVIPQ